MSLSVNIYKKLDDFTLDVAFENESEILALLGASGCGKSITLKCIAGIETPDKGKIVLNGRVLFDSEKKINLTPQKRKVGYLFQEYALFPNMNVENNIKAAVRSKDKEVIKKAAEEKIKAFGLIGLEKKMPYQLSGGQQQRVALARILANEPELLLLDEPFTALDSYLKWKLELELSDLLKEFDKDAVYVSHSRDEVYRLCSSVCILNNGKSDKKVKVKELFETPNTIGAALLSGCKNIAKIEKLDKNTVYIPEWDITLNINDEADENTVYAGIRAHYVKIADDEKDNVINMKVERVIEDVFSTVVMLRASSLNKNLSCIRMELDKEKWKQLENKTDINIYISPKDIMLLAENS